jgi:osmotically inducible protein OsmC
MLPFCSNGGCGVDVAFGVAVPDAVAVGVAPAWSEVSSDPLPLTTKITIATTAIAAAMPRKLRRWFLLMACQARESIRIDQRREPDGSPHRERALGTLGSGAFEGAYSFQSRFGEGENGTNPEELIGAAHAGCFTMALSLLLGQGGNEPESLRTQARVTLRNLEDTGPTITKITLTTTGRVPGIDQDAFQKAAEAAKETCVVSRALAGVEEIVLEATLDG